MIVPVAVLPTLNVLPVIAGPNVNVLAAAALIPRFTAVATPNMLPVVDTPLNTLAVRPPALDLIVAVPLVLLLILVLPLATAY